MADLKFNTPEAVEAAFYEAFAEVDLNLMAAVWRDSDHTLCIHPGGGLRRGKTAVMQSWMEVFSGSAPPVIEYHFIEGFAAGNLAVRLVEERIRPQNTRAEAVNRVLATNVYLRDAKSWRLIEHHASLPLMERGRVAGGERQLH